MKMRASALLATLLVIGAAPTLAVPVLWSFNFPLGLDAEPGSTVRAVGSFTFDAATNTYSDAAFHTTSGGVFPGADYGIVEPGFMFSQGGVRFLGIDGTGETFRFTFTFIEHLTDAGGVSRILESDAGEIHCPEADCTVWDPAYRIRWTSPGAVVVGTPLSPAIPEPSTLALGALGAVVLGMAARRKSRVRKA